MITHLINCGKILICCAGFMILFSILLKKRSIAAPLLSFAFIAIVLFPFTLIGWGKWGIRLLQFLNLISVFASFFLLRRKHNLSYKTLLTFAFIALTCSLLTRYSSLYNWDEFDNYNLAVKSLLLTGKRMPDVTHPEYPFALSLIQYFACAVSDFNEHTMLFISMLVFFSAACYIASFCAHPIRMAIFFCLLACVLTFDFGWLDIYNFPTLLLDPIIALLFSACIVSVMRLSECFTISDVAERALLFAFFIQVKDVCAAFMLIIFLLLFVRLIRSGEMNRHQFKNFVLFALISCLPYLIWFAHLKINSIGRGHALGNITINNLRLLFGNSDNAYKLSLNLFLSHTFTLKYGHTGLSIFGLYLLFFTLSHLMFSFNHDATRLISAGILLIGALGYTVYVGLVYIFVLDGKYPTSFDEYERFILSYLMAWALVIFTEIWRDVNNYISAKILCLLSTCAALCILPVQQILRPQTTSADWIQAKRFYEDAPMLIEGSDAKILPLVRQVMPQTMLRSLFYGEQQILADYAFNIDDGTHDTATLSEYIASTSPDYLYVYRPDEEFWQRYGDLFSSIPENTGRYQIFIPGENGRWSVVEQH